MGASVSLWAVLVAAVAQFAVGGIWYMPLFGKMWGKIHGFDKLDKKTQRAMQQQMMPLLALQLAVTLLMTFVLAHVIKAVPGDSAYKLAFYMWLGFVVPTQVAAVVFGGTAPKWIVPKISIMAGGALACLMAGAAILSWLG